MCLSKIWKRSGRERIILLSEFFPSILTSLLALLITLGSMLRSRLDLQLEILARAIKSESSNTLFITSPTHVRRSSPELLAVAVLVVPESAAYSAAEGLR